ncbi:MAG: DUF3656 domain-containing protein, partial [Verrucomicrobiia bacterium]
DVQLVGEVMVPVSELNRIRRELVSRMEELRRTPLVWEQTQGVKKPRALADGISIASDDSSPSEAELIVLVRDVIQLDAVLESGIETVYCDFEDPKKYRDAVDSVREWNSKQSANVTIFVAPPRIFKPGEEWIIQQVQSSNPDGYLVRNHDHLRLFADERKVGDFSLNVANELTADYFIGEFGLEH